jgi:hypothetical protein
LSAVAQCGVVYLDHDPLREFFFTLRKHPAMRAAASRIRRERNEVQSKDAILRKMNS